MQFIHMITLNRLNSKLGQILLYIHVHVHMHVTCMYSTCHVRYIIPYIMLIMSINDIIGYNYHANRVCIQWTSPSLTHNHYSQRRSTPMAG